MQLWVSQKAVSSFADAGIAPAVVEPRPATTIEAGISWKIRANAR
jgi:hypothetical protein